MADVSLGIAFIAGFLSFLSPCVLPLVPAYVGYMGGRMTHTLALQTSGSKRSGSAVMAVERVNMLAHSLAFVLGFTLVFVSIGLATTALFSVIGTAASLVTDIIGRVGGVLIILFGLHFMGALRWLFNRVRHYPRLLSSPLTALIAGLVISLVLGWGLIEWLIALPFIAGVWLWLVLGGAFQQPQRFWMTALDRTEALLYSDTRRELAPSANTGLGGSFLMGVVFSAGWTPCIGPIYGTILTVAANTGDVATALPLLMAYSLGLGVPFILAGLLVGRLQQVLKRLQRHMHTIERVTGALLVIIGILVASGQLTRLTQVLNNDFADFSTRIEECGVGIFQNRLAVQQLGNCFNGTLHPLVLRQSATVTLAAATTQSFVFAGSANQPIDVQMSRFDSAFTPYVSLLDSTGTLIAESRLLTPVDNELSLALQAIALPQDGLYTVVVGDTAGEFKIKVVAASVESSAAPPTADNTLPIQLAEVASLSTLAQQADPIEGTATGDLAPDFTVTQLDGTVISLSDLRGDVVVLNFWGTWCVPCQREMPELQALYKQLGDMNLTILALAVRDTYSAVEAFVTDHDITFPVVLDTEMIVTRQYGVRGQPTTFIIGTDGRILQVFYSVTTLETLTPVIEDALS